ncbi:hypothetical protein [Clostridium sp. AF22-10]|uniref:hypothetical protein n=1 Tax=Clostridium sp. AF22-10 TaxID=2293004 RepID=UPI000E47D3AB|nr:hypothetical protein DWX91_15065 [Clostridium sp. AF22-10]
MYQNCCKKCGSISLHTEVKGNNTGLYCDDCGAWIKWLGKDELRAFEYVKQTEKQIEKKTYTTNSYGFQDNKADIELGKLCCFKPLDKDEIYFGHMAGKVVDDFGNMTFMYVLNIDNRYFFSRNVIIKPEDVHTSNDAKKYF